MRALTLSSLSLLVVVPGASAAGVQEFALPPGSAPTDVASGPGGALWVTSAAGLLRVSPTGAVSAVPGGSTSGRDRLLAAPVALTPGPSGTLWFVESDATEQDDGTGDGRLGRVRVDGTVQELQGAFQPLLPNFRDVASLSNGTAGVLGAAGPSLALFEEPRSGPEFTETELSLDDDPSAITTDSTGRTLWYTGRSEEILGSVTFDSRGDSTGTEVDAGGAPEDIVLGPDGALWFTKPDAGTVGRVDPRIPTPVVEDVSDLNGMPAGASPTGITTGPDGALWFTAGGANPGVGRIDPATRAVQFTSEGVSPDSEPRRIATGPDGALWFASTTGDRVGRIAADAFAAPPVVVPPVQPPPVVQPPADPPPADPTPVAPPSPAEPAPGVPPAPIPAPVAPPPTSPAPAARVPALRITGITRSARVRAPRRAVVRFRLSAPAGYVVRIERIASPAASTRAQVRPGREVRGRPGSNRVVLPRLSPGRYRITVRATTADGRTDVSRTRIRVLRPVRAAPSFTG